MWKYVLAWFPMVAIAIANGALRESWFGQSLSELAAHQLSTLTAVILFGVYIWFVVRFWPPTSAAQAVAVGLLWLVMTITFEFLFGHSWPATLGSSCCTTAISLRGASGHWCSFGSRLRLIFSFG